MVLMIIETTDNDILILICPFSIFHRVRQLKKPLSSIILHKCFVLKLGGVADGKRVSLM